MAVQISPKSAPGQGRQMLFLFACSLLLAGIVSAVALPSLQSLPIGQISQSCLTPTITATTDITEESSLGLVIDTSAGWKIQAPPDREVSQTFMLRNTTQRPLAFTLATQTEGNGSWLVVSPLSGELLPGENKPITIQMNTAGLASPSEVVGVILLSSADQTQSIFVRLEVVLPTDGTVTPTPEPTMTPTLLPSVTPTTISGSTLLPQSLETTATVLPSPTAIVCSSPTAISTPQGGEPTPSSVTGKACQQESPYGFTTVNADDQLVKLYKELGTCWVRFQMDGSKIQTTDGVYNWSKLDIVVASMNAAGIFITFPIRCIVGGNCFNSPRLPTTSQMTNFATAIAQRYDGKHGHGKIDAFQCGNEEYDFFEPAIYGPLLKACYQAIKAVSNDVPVGMYGTFKPNLTHTEAVMTAIANGYSQYLDFAAFHYYAKGGDPRESTPDHPSLKEMIETTRAILPGKPIWITEVGWPTGKVPSKYCCQAVSPETQAQYLHYVMETAAQSRIVERIFWFTINYGAQPDNIAPPSGPLPAFFTYRELIKELPMWDVIGGA